MRGGQSDLVGLPPAGPDGRITGPRLTVAIAVKPGNVMAGQSVWLERRATPSVAFGGDSRGPQLAPHSELGPPAPVTTPPPWPVRSIRFPTEHSASLRDRRSSPEVTIGSASDRSRTVSVALLRARRVFCMAWAL